MLNHLTETGEPSPLSEEGPPAVVVLAPAPVALVVPRRPCQVVFGGIPASEQVRAEVHAWLEKLGPSTALMTAGQVLIESVDRGRKESHHRVRVSLTLPTGVVMVAFDHPDNNSHEDVYVAIRNAFRAARRQLEVHSRTVAALANGSPS